MAQLSDEVIVAWPERRPAFTPGDSSVRWITAIASRDAAGVSLTELSSSNKREARIWRQRVIKDLATRGSTVHELPEGGGFDALDKTAFMLWPECAKRATPSTNQIQ
jgi:hypothetical protein